MRPVKNHGFNLVELMIAVSIIGIVSAIAVPRYGAMVAKSRQAEAKDGLSHIYERQILFKREWSQFYADFRDTGVKLRGLLYYRIGFGGPGINSPDLTHYVLPNGSPPNVAAVRFTSSLWRADTGPLGGSLLMAERATVCALTGTSLTTATTFTAEACGNIDGDVANDRWTINQEKLLRNISNDVNL
jgi:prepilin-type N-terminal cleavage/methylation domain-containing protein